MREIKFRGRRLDTGEWEYGDLVRRSGYSIFTKTYIVLSHEGELEFIEIDPETKGQYINLKDKNGKEIYEGDILADGAVIEYFESLSWDSGGSIHPGFYCRKWFEYKDDGALSYHYGFDNELNDCLVIGNTYENPELVK